MRYNKVGFRTRMYNRFLQLILICTEDGAYRLDTLGTSFGSAANLTIDEESRGVGKHLDMDAQEALDVLPPEIIAALQKQAK
jgi:hypothetical protein